MQQTFKEVKEVYVWHGVDSVCVRPRAGSDSVTVECSGELPILLEDGELNIGYMKDVVSGSGAVAQGPGAVAVGARGVYIGGSFSGSINTGNKNTINSERTAVDLLTLITPLGLYVRISPGPKVVVR